MKISVIIPVYNVEKYIERCIQSVLDQTFQDFEIVVVNDCTQDHSMDIVRRYAIKDTRISIYENEENLGPMWTRMIGYTQAKGDYFVFCDSDDYMPVSALEILYNAVVADNADITIGCHQRILQDDTLGSISRNTLKYGTFTQGVYRALLNEEINHSLWGRIFSRKLFQNYKYDTFKHFTNGEDACLFYQIIQHVNKVTAVEDVVYYYYFNDQSSSNKRLSRSALLSITTVWSIMDQIISPYDSLYVFVQKRNIKSFCSLLRQGYSFNNLMNMIKIKNFDRLFSWWKLQRIFSVDKALKYYCIIFYYSKLRKIDKD